MGENDDVKNSTLIVGVVVTLALVVASTLIAQAVAPGLTLWAGVPSVLFLTVFVSARRRRRVGGKRH